MLIETNKLYRDLARLDHLERQVHELQADNSRQVEKRHEHAQRMRDAHALVREILQLCLYSGADGPDELRKRMHKIEDVMNQLEKLLSQAK